MSELVVVGFDIIVEAEQEAKLQAALSATTTAPHGAGSLPSSIRS
jgi:hypothetical protein